MKAISAITTRKIQKPGSILRSLALTAFAAFCLHAACSCATGESIKPFSPDDEDVSIDFISIPDHPFYGMEPQSGKGADAREIGYENESAIASDSQEDLRKTAKKLFDDNLAEPKASSQASNSTGSIIEYGFSDGKIYTMLASTDMITDLRFEPGESLAGDMAIADQSLLIIDPMISAENDQEIMHLLFRAAMPEGQTTMIIPTNKRTYYFKVILTSGTGMFGIRFKSDRKISKQPLSSKPGSESKDLRGMDFDYTISASGDVKPVAVFSDGKSTYIQFSKRFYATDINPALYLQDESGMSIINYTIKGNMYVVDFILGRNESFLLLSGKSKSIITKEFFLL